MLRWMGTYPIRRTPFHCRYCMCFIPNTLLAHSTHWGRVTHICVDNLTIIGSDNGLSPGRLQAIIWSNAGILLIRTLGINFSEILSKIHTFSFKKIHFKMSSAKWRPFCLGLNVLRNILSAPTLAHLLIPETSPPMYYNGCNNCLEYKKHGFCGLSPKPMIFCRTLNQVSLPFSLRKSYVSRNTSPPLRPVLDDIFPRYWQLFTTSSIQRGLSSMSCFCMIPCGINKLSMVLLFVRNPSLNSSTFAKHSSVKYSLLYTANSNIFAKMKRTIILQ